MNIRKDISVFFGIGKKEGVEFKNIEDIDKAIEQAVLNNYIEGEL